jgi:hypothetical protein
VYILHTGIQGWIPAGRKVGLVDFLGDTTKKTPHSVSLPPVPPALPVPKPITLPPKLDRTPAEEKEYMAKELGSEENFPNEIPIKDHIGKSDLMFPRTYSEFHNATPMLKSYAKKGCPVDCGPEWTREKILLLLRRGPHRSSKNKNATRQLRLETKEKVKCGYARVVRWGDVKTNLPAKLKISPVAMIPHKSKAFRCILDLSFTLHHEGTSYASVNATTNPLAKAEAMAQLGFCLQRLVATIADNFNPNKPFMFSKLDIKDGFWRMRVSDEDAWNFCYVLPSLKPVDNEDDIELVVPNSLQMGWCESPPFFCSGSETARDIIEEILLDPSLPAHRFEDIMLKTFIEDNIEHSTGNTTILEVFVDDFVCATNNLTTKHLRQVSRAMVNGIHAIFPPPEVTGHPGGDPVSEKKLAKREGVWDFCKEILGWDFDGKNYTIQLPPEKCKAIILQIRQLLQLQRPSLNKYQKIAGKLQHAAFGIPCGRALFSPIQEAMRHNPEFIPLTNDLRQIFSDWQYMIKFMMNHPTSVLQLVVHFPDYIGYSDACGLGAGGVWTDGMKKVPRPFLWQVEWPTDIKNSLVSSSNPTGTITINDLELAGMVLGWLALECQEDIPLAFHHIGAFCDNTSAVAWAQKLRTSTSKIAGRLLRVLGLRIHARQASSVIPLHIAGEENIMADIVSRAFKNGKFFMAQQSLVSYFNKNFPLPQDASWTEHRMPNELVLRVISCLRGKLFPMASLLRLPRIVTNTGATGADIVPCSNVTPSSVMKLLSTETQSSAPSVPESEGERLAEDIKSRFKPSRTRSRPSTRPFSWLENKRRSTGTDKAKNTT